MDSLLQISFKKSKKKHLETILDRSGRLTEFEKEKELDKIRDVLIEHRMIEDIRLPKKKGYKTIVEVTGRVTELSDTMKTAMNYDEIQSTVVKEFNFKPEDVLNYVFGRKAKLFDKIKILDADKFKVAQLGSDMSIFTHQDLPKEEKERGDKPESMNTVEFLDYDKALNFEENTRIESNIHNQTYLTDGYTFLKQKYDYLQGKFYIKIYLS